MEQHADLRFDDGVAIGTDVVERLVAKLVTQVGAIAEILGVMLGRSFCRTSSRMSLQVLYGGPRSGAAHVAGAGSRRQLTDPLSFGDVRQQY
ncbi:hypothetical protein [Burkholderia metallica]